MKKTKRILLIVLAMVLVLITDNVYAATYGGRFYEQGWQQSKVGVFAREKNGYMDYNGWFIKSTKDNNTYYCIDPATPLEGAKAGSHNQITGKTSMINNSKLTTGNFEKINLLAYYGYGYKEGNINHTAKKWYGVTQVMIWRIMRPKLTWTFKTTRNGTASNNYFKNEKRESEPKFNFFLGLQLNL